MWVNFVNAVEPRLASFRYRSVWPSLAIAEQYPCLITDDASSVPLDAGTDGIIFTKAFTQKSLELAWEARKHDIPIVLDLCDNIFVPGYLGGTNGLLTVACFRSMAEFSDCIIVPTQALGEIVRQQLAGNAPPLNVIPDCVEREADVRRLLRLLNQDKNNAQVVNGSVSISDNLQVINSASKLDFGRSHLPTLPESLDKLKNRVLQTTRQAINNDLTANRAAFRNRYKSLKQALRLDKLNDYSRPSRPNLSQKSMPLAADVPRKTVLWFGNAGHSHGDYGIATILRFANALGRIHAQTPIELLVVSNNEGKFNEYVRRLPIPSRYAEWDPVGVFEHLQSADVVIIPNSNDSFSRTKSANRVVLALSQGVPVVAEDFAALELLRDCVACEDPYQGLRRYLVQDKGQEDLDKAQTVLDQHFSKQRVGEQMALVLSDIKAKDPRQRPCLLFVLDLLQDLEVLRPVMEHFIGRDNWRVRILVSKWLMAQSSPLHDFFADCGIVPTVMERQDILSGTPDPVIAASLVFTASETNLGPHKVAHHIARQARKAGITAVTFQHGLENEGLTYFGENKSVRFASEKIIVWGDIDPSHAKLCQDTLRKCLPMGMFRSLDRQMPSIELRQKLHHNKVVGVFENLHWERYSESYRIAFIQNLIHTARRNLDCCFLVKPHPAGRWFSLSNRETSCLPGNVVTIDDKDDFLCQLSGTQLAGLVDAVITTPSTIAVDAAIAKVPIAVVAHEMQGLELYAGLDLLRSADDWTGFVKSCQVDQIPILQRAERFLAQRVTKLNPMTELEAEVSKLVS